MSSILTLFPKIKERHYFQDPETGEFWFNATGVCESLGFANVSRTLGMYTDEDERFQEIINGRVTWFVSEAGCYGLAMAAKTEQAKKFKRWLKHDVLPKLRADGLYILNNPSAAKDVAQKQLVARQLGKVERLSITDGIKAYMVAHGLTDGNKWYGGCTQNIYLALFGCTKSKLLEARGIPNKRSITPRDYLDASELELPADFEHKAAILMIGFDVEPFAAVKQTGEVFKNRGLVLTTNQ